jgi:hypothetical protein
MLYVDRTSDVVFALSGLFLAETTFIGANDFLNLFLHLGVKSFTGDYQNLNVLVRPLM